MTINMAMVLNKWLVAAFFIALNSIICRGFFIGPLHASCRAEWTFSADCKTVEKKLVDIIHKWVGPDNCINGGEKCLYSLTYESDTEIQAVHETPKKHYKDDLTMSFATSENNGCHVNGYSKSETWYAHLDYSTNYCNMRNLINGAGLDKDRSFKETTDDSKCTQYSTANCDKY